MGVARRGFAGGPRLRQWEPDLALCKAACTGNGNNRRAFLVSVSWTMIFIPVTEARQLSAVLRSKCLGEYCGKNRARGCCRWQPSKQASRRADGWTRKKRKWRWGVEAREGGFFGVQQSRGWEKRDAIDEGRPSAPARKKLGGETEIIKLRGRKNSWLHVRCWHLCP